MCCSKAARMDTVYQEDESQSLECLLQEGYKGADTTGRWTVPADLTCTDWQVRVLLCEELTVVLLVKKFPVFYSVGWFGTMFTIAWSLYHVGSQINLVRTLMLWCCDCTCGFIAAHIVVIFLCTVLLCFEHCGIVAVHIVLPLLYTFSYSYYYILWYCYCAHFRKLLYILWYCYCAHFHTITIHIVILLLCTFSYSSYTYCDTVTVHIFVQFLYLLWYCYCAHFRTVTIHIVILLLYTFSYSYYTYCNVVTVHIV